MITDDSHRRQGHGGNHKGVQTSRSVGITSPFTARTVPARQNCTRKLLREWKRNLKGKKNGACINFRILLRKLINSFAREMQKERVNSAEALDSSPSLLSSEVLRKTKPKTVMRRQGRGGTPLGIKEKSEDSGRSY